MSTEIERRFFVSDLRVIEGRGGARIVQGYLADEPMTVRVRIIEAESFLTLKRRIDEGIARDEYEFPIPMHQARELLERHCGKRVIEKTRYRVAHDGLTWEVDVFAGTLQGLVIAEVELDAVDQVFALPAWVGIEITDDPRYSNSAMSMTGEIPATAL